MIAKFIVLLVIVSVGCRRPQNEGQSSSSAGANNLVGLWDAALSLAHPYPLEPDSPTARSVCGTLGFVDNHGRIDGGTESEPLQIGVYDLALTRIGLEWRGEPAFPVAVASGGAAPDSSSRAEAGDSVRIVLNPGSDERIVLLGRYDARRIEGEWTAQSARGTASGAFSLRPHSIRRDASQRCEGTTLTP